ncbi:MAG: four helix bundle protein [Algoriphagus sp.]|jgi:four helix bundle protein|uniref:four helix bundle protein n=1 Tax=Algoriphagus sp. TaxID=1872435 RepID=UPI001ECF05AF|nr:four helix bundle protein [Algoriphagus sp.]MBA4299072.1 four helix bundle protein [Cyclobacterium sp.]MDO8968908.1 four helix bundle protein [Algoriphagus sp.]MDP2040656.1 four helix bundle protein [Algoriphagus sp.]MDP3201322.1 four helix bundle protein [Algoriphagus sp.]MDP3471984.1 four helix bundle protein [Algoriphagus sp.]
MAFKFENLQVWQKAMDLNDLIFEISKEFPIEERYNLTSQIRRAIDSVSLNIAEGSTSQTNPEFARFLGYSIRSVVEVVCALFIAKRRNYLSNEIFQEAYSKSEELVKMIQSLKNHLK